MNRLRPSRSSLFVPGHRATWIEKAAGYGADTLILDLEDAVPDQEKVAARATVKAGLKALHATGQAASVRVNGFATGLTLDDLEGIFCPELTSVTLPKIETPADLHELDALLTALERRHGMPVGGIETPLGLETAKGMRNVYEIATQCRRVVHVSLAAGPGGDAARAIGYQWSKEGTETLFLRSKVILDARAAGIQYPTISSWWNIKDLDGLERDARWNRQLGYRGQTVMHPSHVPIVNAVFTPTADEIAFYQGLIDAMEDAVKRGIAAVTYKGDMVDEAMVKTAREMLAFAQAIGVVK
ncbi:MAG: CoA ester lyase [Candidatus Rokubacteria bacterium]|nr:CoA ester lyase [Candidatus Rokubacteria bacterium]